MDPILLLARVLHIVFGAFWAGTLIFNAEFLFPAMQAAGPAGGAVGTALIQRRFLDALPIAALLTVLSGFWLFQKAAAGFGPAYMGSRAGITYSIGAALALVGFVLGMAIVRPSMLKAAGLSKAAMEGAPADRDRVMGEAQALRLKAGKTGKIIARLLGVTLITMAVARYL